ncbi:MAG: hypothetical protein IT287_08880 [Bdellovibrionaceae bacterium]|nr:hypothetical protein [Pseudobdellovibrionaceae bacterium]
MKFLLYFLISTLFCTQTMAFGKKATSMNKNEVGPDGLPIIFWTIKSDDVDKLKKLLDNGFDIEAQGYHKATPILSAAKIESWHIVKILADKKAKLNVVDGTGFSLAWLVQNSQVKKGSIYEKEKEEVKLLLDKNGLMNKLYEPKVIREMIKNGSWPPPDWLNEPVSIKN